MTDTIQTLTERYKFRQRLVDDLVIDLQGPEAVDEVLDEMPLDRYITGILWPAPSEDGDSSAEEVDFAEISES